MHGFMRALARGFALLGGFVLLALIALICLSIVGRCINSIGHSDFMQTALPGLASALLASGVGPINGDYEIVEAGMAFAIFAFLPLCQFNGSHAFVDVFTATLPERVNRLLRVVIEMLFAAVLILIAWKLFGGLQSKFRSGQTSFLLGYPIWWAYAASLGGAVITAIVASYIAMMRLLEALTGRLVLSPDREADH